MNLSIITVNLNNVIGLRKTIESVVSQSFTDYEWIVVDGGSNDGSRELIENFDTRFSYWVSEPDTGIYNAMNKGIAHAHGDWLLFLNSGDWLFSDDVLEKVFSSEHQCDVLYGDVMYHWPDARGKQLEVKPDSLSLYYFYTETLCHQTTFYKKDIFNSHRYNEEFRICSDWALYIQLMLEGYRFCHLPFCISNFPQDGISSNLNEKHFAERQTVKEAYFPDYIRPDLERLRLIDEHNKHISSHRSFKYIMEKAERRIAQMEKVVKFFEKMKS